ncbi:agmatinase [Strigomonas culicis]|uniref:Agmatinase n=1 Tax=Strigomonas culicis TaxID=28005 RepID=S9URV4_9TRYP|nr:agmatinase [Strigomonas culicis]|eukprot:EPY31618.1 agmatinase [Strigomonas culicis]
MFSKFLSHVKGLPPRSTDWANRMGPVALMGYSGGIPQSANRLLQHFYACPRDSDIYAEMTFHKTAPIECPPETVFFMPVLECGNMLAEGEAGTPSKDDWYLASTQATTELTEKSYVPVSVGGNGPATLSMIEAYKNLFPTEDVVLLHFSAHPNLVQDDAPIRVLLEKNLLKGVVSVGNRCVTSMDRKIRKQHHMFYMDMHAIYSKGLFCIRDIRNDYPVFISIDASVMDPAFAPAVETPIPGGLSTRELLHIMNGIRGPKVIGVDIHGYNPALDIHRGDGIGLTQMALAKVLKESILKCYTISTQTEEEGMARVQMMQRQGTISENPYPDH